jgi:squalene-hopene/tetraprenyl-beta-curcumene cyclase
VKVVRQVGNVHDNKWQVRNVLDEVGKAPREIQDLVREDGNVGHVKMGLRWLLNLQNRDGGWPTFCRGWGTLPFDRSGSDLTAHALRAIHAWRGLNVAGARSAMSRGVRYLQSQQQRDGSWLPLWFGNQDKPGDENPVYGTCKVLCAYRDLEQLHSQPAQRGAGWLLENQNPDGGWGGGKSVCWPLEELGQSSVEETALAVEVMAEFAEDEKFAAAFERGARWLVLAVRNGFHTVPTPIGFYFAKLWYYEDAYPLVFAVSALGRVARRLCGGATSAADAVGRVTLK